MLDRVFKLLFQLILGVLCNQVRVLIRFLLENVVK